jgi:hypothetical protein
MNLELSSQTSHTWVLHLPFNHHDDGLVHLIADTCPIRSFLNSLSMLASVYCCRLFTFALKAYMLPSN